MDTDVVKRLDRLENKIDKLVDVIASMARVEEKIVGQDARLKRHEFRLDENERKIEEVGEATQTNSFIAKVGTTLVATIWAGLVAYVFYIFRGE
jgi:tetrahydromethanopterin S-methyltransferase subunit G